MPAQLTEGNYQELSKDYLGELTHSDWEFNAATNCISTLLNPDQLMDNVNIFNISKHVTKLQWEITPTQGVIAIKIFNLNLSQANEIKTYLDTPKAPHTHITHSRGAPQASSKLTL
jgi:hypothetical protein